MSDQKDFTVTASPNVVSVLAGNPGLSFTRAQLDAIQRGTLVLVGVGSITIGGSLTPKGCITRLFYGSSSEDLDFVEVDGVYYAPSNLKDFRERFEDAARHGLRINFCLDKNTNKMSMLNLYPCGCCAHDNG